MTYDYDYDYEDRMDDARRDAQQDYLLERLREIGPCDGGGILLTPCSGRHRYLCGGPDCDGGDEVDCPGCENCQPEG